MLLHLFLTIWLSRASLLKAGLNPLTSAISPRKGMYRIIILAAVTFTVIQGLRGCLSTVRNATIPKQSNLTRQITTARRLYLRLRIVLFAGLLVQFSLNDIFPVGGVDRIPFGQISLIGRKTMYRLSIAGHDPPALRIRRPIPHGDDLVESRHFLSHHSTG